jgi:preprotein translocase subunit SecY
LFQTAYGQRFGFFVSDEGLRRLSILSLVLVPYLSAAVFVQMLSMVWWKLSSLERSGEAGRQRIARYTLILTMLLAALQAFFIASALQDVPGLVVEPGGWFLLSATSSMVGGVFFLIWLSELITRYGIGNGLALVLSVGFVASLPSEVARIINAVQKGVVSANLALFHIILWVAVVALIVFVEGARRNVRLEFAERKIGMRTLPARSAVLPIKINSAGFQAPVILQSWVLTVPFIVAGSMFGATPWLVAAINHMKFGQPAHLVVGSIAVFVLAFIYTSYVLDPEYAAERLGKQGGSVPGVVPGEPTADYLDGVVTSTTVIGAVYLTAVALIPEALVASGHMLPYNFHGGAALIVICTILDIQKQVRDLARTDRGAEANENYTSGTAGFGKGDPGAAAG